MSGSTLVQRHPFAPLVVAAAPVVFLQVRSGRDIDVAAVIGAMVGLGTVLGRAIVDQLRGPTLLHTRPAWPELVLFVVIGLRARGSRAADGLAISTPENEHLGMPTTDELIAANRVHAESFRPITTGARPRRKLAVVACMDVRLDIFEMLGLADGDVHVIRNAGGVVTDDVIRSLLISQRALGTTHIVLIHHTDCGMSKITDDGLRAELEAETGMRPTFAIDAFTDVMSDVRQSMVRLHNSPFVDSSHVRGFVYSVETGLLEEILLRPTG